MRFYGSLPLLLLSYSPRLTSRSSMTLWSVMLSECRLELVKNLPSGDQMLRMCISRHLVGALEAAVLVAVDAAEEPLQPGRGQEEVRGLE